MGFVANFIRFPTVQNNEDRLRCHKVREFKGENFVETPCSC